LLYLSLLKSLLIVQRHTERRQEIFHKILKLGHIGLAQTLLNTLFSAGKLGVAEALLIGALDVGTKSVRRL
jgi:hypothetical protein